MNRIVQKTLSLFLLVLITLLTFDHFKIIKFNPQLKNSFIFIIIIFSIISAMSVILSHAPGFMKFINYAIITFLFLGGLYFIITSQINLFIYAFLIITVSYSLMDMIYKK